MRLRFNYKKPTKVKMIQSLVEKSLYFGLLNRNEEKLSVTLSDEQKETFEKYKDCNREISEICERQSFITGFKLGAKIVIESMT